MKKKYRKAIRYSILVIYLIILSPIMILGIIGGISTKLFVGLCNLFPNEWLKTKLRVHDYDPDYEPKREENYD